MMEIALKREDSHEYYITGQVLNLESAEDEKIRLEAIERVPEESKIRAGNFLRTKREAKHLSLRYVASKCKISYSSLSRIENGKEFPSAALLRSLAPYLSIPYDELLFAVGYSFQAKGDDPIYLDLNGNPIDISEKALKLYSKNVELFFQAEHWLDCCSAEDEELVFRFLKLLIAEGDCKKKEKGSLSEQDDAVMNFMQGIRHLIQSSDLLLEKQLPEND